MTTLAIHDGHHLLTLCAEALGPDRDITFESQVRQLVDADPAVSGQVLAKLLGGLRHTRSDQRVSMPQAFTLFSSPRNSPPPLQLLPAVIDGALMAVALNITRSVSFNLGDDWAITYKKGGEKLTLAWVPSHETIESCDLGEAVTLATGRYLAFMQEYNRARKLSPFLGFLKPDLFLPPALLTRLKNYFDIQEARIASLLDQALEALQRHGEGTVEALKVDPALFTEIMRPLLAALEEVKPGLEKFFNLLKLCPQEKASVLVSEIHDFRNFPLSILQMAGFWSLDLVLGQPIDVQVLGRASSLAEVFKRIGAEKRHAARVKGIELHISCEDDLYRLTTTVARNLKLLRRLLANFLDNALKYHKPEGDNRYVDIVSDRVQDSLRFTIADNGLGMTPEDLARCGSERAFRAEATRHKQPGNGEGLYACFRSIERLGGKIVTKESAVGKGTKFVFDLPLRHFKRAGTGTMRSAAPLVAPRLPPALSLAGRR